MTYPVTEEAARRLREQYEASPRWLQTIERTIYKGVRDAVIFGAAAALLTLYGGEYDPRLIYASFATTAWRTFRDVLPSVIASLRGAVEE